MEGIYSFNAKGALEECMQWIQNQSEKDKFNKVILGISGGKDSTVAATLCTRVFGADNVHGLLIPNGEQKDINDSINICKILGIKYDIINIKPIYDAYIKQYNSSVDGAKAEPKEDREASLINLVPRIRMSMIRLWGQTHHHRVCGTGNYSEITVGYCTKDGDTSCDFNPLARLTSVEVVEIGKLLEEIPKKYILKTPSDGLCGVSDEEKLGVSYEDIHRYIRSLNMSKETWYKINDMERKGLHKRTSGSPIYIPSEKVLCDINHKIYD